MRHLYTIPATIIGLSLGNPVAAAPPFVAPAERPVEQAAQPWLKNKLAAISWHDVSDDAPDQERVAVRTSRLIEQLSWLRENGYVPVSVDAVIAAHRGGASLPDRAALLTFDDGYASFYKRVYPILKAYGWPAVFAPVGKWVSTPAGHEVAFGDKNAPRDQFVTWEQVREMAASGLVEIASHTHDMHRGVLANPQGNSEPAAATRIYDAQSGRYESDEAYRARIADDARTISDEIKEATGKRPRVWVWPYGAYSGTALSVIGEHGFELTLSLSDNLIPVDQSNTLPRLLLANDPRTADFAAAVVNLEERQNLRVIHVDLDYIYDPDPAQMDRNLGLLVQRVADMGVNTVFLQAFADPEGDGLIRSLYFPNRWLPMRADLFNRVAWQLRTRAAVNVYAWMPVLGFDLDPALPRVLRWNEKTGKTEVDPDQYRRLSPFDPEVRRQIGEIYEDLSKQASFDGILFHDDALLSDFEDVSPAALKAYAQAGLPEDISAIRADPAAMQRWTRLKSRALIDFTTELAGRVRAIRGDDVKTARSIFAQPVLEPDSEAWFAQNLDDFLAAYDWTAPMAMPLMEKIPPADVAKWMDALVDAVAARPGALDRTIFELQARDWSADKNASDNPVDPAVLADWMKRLERRGARSFGYYPDDFVAGKPDIGTVRPAISTAWYPFK
ncbi:poly-beta-1,6-N-acetyl-D-glucosamine N-deacetylase PgaB [Sphingobium aromaticiconvertens]|uniref:poly-beta-1,6-N-acetyl-D-glucosamine N-deacetylase PgaB n=1 Tax=Sphingobium aromaticiconvertens TaxID=365341 RepID=UPI0030191A66